MTKNYSPPGLFAVPGPVFAAKYRGVCELCRQRFPADTRIRYIAKNTVAHEVCATPRGSINPINDPLLGAEEWAVRYGPGGNQQRLRPNEPKGLDSGVAHAVHRRPDIFRRQARQTGGTR
jgi:hypothetical protein